MARPSFYEHAPDHVEVRETHLSWVFLADELVYKVKKPVSYSFVDYSDLEQRRLFCEEEVRLNRRLAPKTYLGVRAIVARSASYQLAEPEAPDAIDYAVEMRRLCERGFADGMAERGELGPDRVRAIGRRLADFHASCDRLFEDRRAAEQVKRTASDNFETLLSCGVQAIGKRRLRAAERFTAAFVIGHAELFFDRRAKGHVRDGHGDLRLEHVVFADGSDLEIFDCVEFNPQLRQIDVASDLAFLVMDLASRGCDELATELVAGYRERGGDPGDEALLSFYAGYRAFVRAKIDTLRALQLPTDETGQKTLLELAERFFALGERFIWQARKPIVLVLCGVSASGKSHLASELARRSQFWRTSSDITRKRLAGIEPASRALPEHYTDAMSRKVYGELGRGAHAAVRSGQGAIVDATFRRKADREAFAAGLGDMRASVIYVECRAPSRVLAERARMRLCDTGRATDATPDVVRMQMGEFEALDEIAAGKHVTLRTDQPVEFACEELEAFLDTRSNRAQLQRRPC